MCLVLNGYCLLGQKPEFLLSHTLKIILIQVSVVLNLASNRRHDRPVAQRHQLMVFVGLPIGQSFLWRIESPRFQTNCRSLSSWRAKAVETCGIVGPLGVAEIGVALGESDGLYWRPSETG
jgi:hypothetical protein